MNCRKLIEPRVFASEGGEQRYAVFEGRSSGIGQLDHSRLLLRQPEPVFDKRDGQVGRKSVRLCAGAVIGQIKNGY